MRTFSFFLINVIAFAIVNTSDELLTFRKCCEINGTLLKVNDTINVSYECIDKSVIENANYVSAVSFIVGKEYVTISGMPEGCNMSNIIETEVALTSADNQCVDIIATEIINGTEKPIISRVIGLVCEDYKNKPLLPQVENARKCCPDRKTYDVENHVCRNDEKANTDENILSKFFETDYYVYELEHDLFCKPDQYAVELREEIYDLSLNGSSIKVRKGKYETTFYRGEWCVDREYSTGNLIARVCTQNCSDFGLCIRKCCPVGQHYVPRYPNSAASSCVLNNEDAQLLNLSYYIDPLRSSNRRFTETIGLASGLRCLNGKFVLNKTSDSHYLTSNGSLINSVSVSGFTNDFCFETIDNRTWGGVVTVETVTCFERLIEEKNFRISFVTITISCVCLTITLVVYLSLLELRNLHGRTVICHVSVMLLAYGCLARVQYGLVEDNKACTIYGYGIYFGFVAAFMWLNVMCFDIWWTFGSMRSVQPFRKADSERRRFIWYSIYAWSVTFGLTLITFLFDIYSVAEVLDANIGNSICWFGSVQNSKNDWPHYIFFVIPMGLITGTNLILWILTARHCARVKNEVHRMQAGSIGDRAKKRFRADRAKYLLTVKLWVVMGAGWVWEILSTVVSEPQMLWVVVDIINELQGFFIFIILVFKPKVFLLIKKKLGLEKTGVRKSDPSGATASTFLSRTISSDERAILRTSVPITGKAK